MILSLSHMGSMSPIAHVEAVTGAVPPEGPPLRRGQPLAGYMVQLDAFRAWAVATVVVHHYAPWWGYGAYTGVRLFFTVSGFLITGLLLRARDDAEARGVGRLGALGRFYARRTLRIFPLYFFVVGVAYAVDLAPARRLIGWLVTYTLNIHMARQGWFEENVAHFWSLAVEEQFYLGWPWLMLFLPRRWLIAATAGVIVVGPVYRLSYVLSGYKSMAAIATDISTLSCVDTLGLGALLALLVHRQAVPHWLTLSLAPLALALAVLLALLPDPRPFLVLHSPIQAVGFCGLIYGASRGFGGAVGRLLAWKPLSYVGKISYGIYVYHPFMPKLAVVGVAAATGLALDEGGAAALTLATLMTLGVASLSWHLMESRFNDLKRYF
jgi:peptidoglycan/LPS O-acetylase OafA/YrhL